MSSRQRDRDSLEDILNAIERIELRTQGVLELEFSDELVQVYVAHRLMNIGEAASRVSAELRLAHPEVPWRLMKDMRNKIVHDYDRLSLPVLWDSVKHHLPPLAIQLRQILATFTPSDPLP